MNYPLVARVAGHAVSTDYYINWSNGTASFKATVAHDTEPVPPPAERQGEELVLLSTPVLRFQIVSPVDMQRRALASGWVQKNPATRDKDDHPF